MSELSPAAQRELAQADREEGLDGKLTAKKFRSKRDLAEQNRRLGTSGDELAKLNLATASDAHAAKVVEQEFDYLGLRSYRKAAHRTKFPPGERS